MIPFRGHQRNRDVDVPVRPRGPLGAAAEQPELVDCIGAARPADSFDKPIVGEVDPGHFKGGPQLECVAKHRGYREINIKRIRSGRQKARRNST